MGWRRFLFLGALSLGALAASSGCAEGSTQDFSADGGAGPSSGSMGAKSSSGSNGASTSSSAGSTSAGMGTGAGSTSSGGTCSYAATTTCASSKQLMEIPGDEGAPMGMENGTTTAFLKFQVRETQFDPIEGDEEPLSYKLVLTSPPGMDYDVFAFEGPNDGSAVCSGTMLSGVEAGQVDTLASTWNDNIDFGDDKDDHRWISVEVRYVSGTACGDGARWTLAITR